MKPSPGPLNLFKFPIPPKKFCVGAKKKGGGPLVPPGRRPLFFEKVKGKRVFPVFWPLQPMSPGPWEWVGQENSPKPLPPEKLKNEVPPPTPGGNAFQIERKQITLSPNFLKGTPSNPNPRKNFITPPRPTRLFFPQFIPPAPKIKRTYPTTKIPQLANKAPCPPPFGPLGT